MLSWFLLQEGQNILVIDEYDTSSSSNIAAGVTNPITGRRLVKTWLADKLIPFSKATYSQLEELLGEKFYHPVSLFKPFDSVKAQNDWSSRCASSEYRLYLSNDKVIYLDNARVKNELGGFEINGGTQLQTARFLSLYRNFLLQKAILLNKKFEPDKLTVKNDTVTYGNLTARKIIFCEGAGAINSPYFKFLPFQLAKGECLLVRIDDFYPDRIILGEVFIMPTGEDNIYYIGATHDWNFHDALPSETGKNELEGNLRAVLNCNYEFVGHKGAIRPTVKDRRPFIGFHPEHPNVGIFNGMGTKGVSLAPYFAKHFVEHLVHNKDLMPEVDIHRFV